MRSPSEMRRPDGSGGPLSDGERIDDIQFYADASAELIIDDIVLYEPITVDLSPVTPAGFPSHILFAGGFDTGRQGKEWPGDFEIGVPGKPMAGKAARSIPDPSGQGAGLRISLRGARPLSGKGFTLSFRSWLTEGDRIEVSADAGPWVAIKDRELGWDEHWVPMGEGLRQVSEIRFRVPGKGILWVDDLLLFER